MQAWKENDRIDFNFFDAHELNTARDSSLDGTIKTRLRERMNNSKQAILLGSPSAKSKGNIADSFLGFEVRYLMSLKIPIVVANLDKSRIYESNNVPSVLGNSSYYTVNVSFQPKIIQHALDYYAEQFQNSQKVGPYCYTEATYTKLGL
jgi:hypothetical protein